MNERGKGREEWERGEGKERGLGGIDKRRVGEEKGNDRLRRLGMRIGKKRII